MLLYLPPQTGKTDKTNAYEEHGSGFRDRIAVYAGIEVCFVLLATDMTSLGLGRPEDDITRDLDFVLFEYVSDPHWQGLEKRYLRQWVVAPGEHEIQACPPESPNEHTNKFEVP